MGHKSVNPAFFLENWQSAESWYRWNNILIVYSTGFYSFPVKTQGRSQGSALAACAPPSQKKKTLIQTSILWFYLWIRNTTSAKNGIGEHYIPIKKWHSIDNTLKVVLHQKGYQNILAFWSIFSFDCTVCEVLKAQSLRGALSPRVPYAGDLKRKQLIPYKNITSYYGRQRK